MSCETIKDMEIMWENQSYSKDVTIRHESCIHKDWNKQKDICQCCNKPVVKSSKLSPEAIVYCPYDLDKTKCHCLCLATVIIKENLKNCTKHSDITFVHVPCVLENNVPRLSAVIASQYRSSFIGNEFNIIKGVAWMMLQSQNFEEEIYDAFLIFPEIVEEIPTKYRKESKLFNHYCAQRVVASVIEDQILRTELFPPKPKWKYIENDVWKGIPKDSDFDKFEDEMVYSFSFERPISYIADQPFEKVEYTKLRNSGHDVIVNILNENDTYSNTTIVYPLNGFSIQGTFVEWQKFLKSIGGLIGLLPYCPILFEFETQHIRDTTKIVVANIAARSRNMITQIPFYFDFNGVQYECRGGNLSISNAFKSKNSLDKIDLSVVY